MLRLIFLIASVALCVSLKRCPSGGEIFELGVNNEGKTTVLKAHNDYRKSIENGLVSNQPKGINMTLMTYDEKLGKAGRAVSKTCRAKHVLAKDDRWWWIGQNLFIEWSSVKQPGQDWEKAAASWFKENKHFTYPNISTGQTGHYTQMIWANSTYLGCDYIFFYDTHASKAKLPYTKLYTCNYGPGGNVLGELPYQTDENSK